jgi:hypothetical protein
MQQTQAHIKDLRLNTERWLTYKGFAFVRFKFLC